MFAGTDTSLLRVEDHALLQKAVQKTMDEGVVKYKLLTQKLRDLLAAKVRPRGRGSETSMDNSNTKEKKDPPPMKDFYESFNAAREQSFGGMRIKALRKLLRDEHGAFRSGCHVLVLSSHPGVTGYDSFLRCTWRSMSTCTSVFGPPCLFRVVNFLVTFL